MGERKVLNKYYPPEFDWSKIPKMKRPKDRQEKSRIMLPMTITCTTCGEYMYKGKKFNARKELVHGEEYCGVKIFRFYFRCTKCAQEITFKTDPKNSDYVVELGAVRNYEPMRDAEAAEKAFKEKREAEGGDAMKALETRTYDSKREMDILDALDEIRMQKRQLAKLTHDDILESHYARVLAEDQANEEMEEEDDEALIASIFHGQKVIRRLEEEEDDDDGSEDEDFTFKSKPVGPAKPVGVGALEEEEQQTDGEGDEDGMTGSGESKKRKAEELSRNDAADSKRAKVAKDSNGSSSELPSLKNSLLASSNAPPAKPKPTIASRIVIQKKTDDAKPSVSAPTKPTLKATPAPAPAPPAKPVMLVDYGSDEDEESDS